MRKGFTLLEVVICIAIIAIIVLPLATLNMSNIRQNKTTFNREEAYSIAKAACEKFKSEALLVNDSSVTLYVNSVDDLYQMLTAHSDSIVRLINGGTSMTDNTGKKYSITLKGVRGDLNILNVTVAALDSYKGSVKLKASK